MAMEALRVAAKESKFMKFVLGGFIFLAVGGLVFTDVGGYFTGGAGGTTVARVGDTKIDIREFDSELRGFLQQTGLTAEDAYNAGLVNAFLQGKIDNTLRVQAALDLDLVLDNETIAKQIQQTFKGASKDQIAMTLRAQGLSEKQFANAIQSQTITNIVSRMPLSVANYTPSYVVDAQSRIASEQRSGTLYTVPLSSLVEDITITEDQIMDYYQSNQSLFVVEEERTFTIGKMTLDMAKANLPSITEDDVKADYDARQDDFIIPETRTIEQAVVKDPDTAQAIYEAVMNGEALKDALGDKGTYRAANGYQQDALPVELANVAFDQTVKAGDVTPPVKTFVGYIVMQINDIKAESVKPYDAVKDEIKKEMAQAAIYDSLYNKMIDTEDMIDSGESFETIAEKTGLRTSKTQSYSKSTIASAEGDLKKILESNPSIIDEVYGLPDNGATYPVEIDEETYVVIGVQNIEPETVMPLDLVKDDIKKSLLQSQQTAMAQVELEQLLNDLNAGTKTTSDIKGASKSFKNLKRDTDSLNKDLIFSIPKGQFAYRLDGQNAIIANITDVNFDNDKADVKPDTIVQSQRAMIDSLLMQYYRDNTSINVNERLLERAYSGQSE